MTAPVDLEELKRLRRNTEPRRMKDAFETARAKMLYENALYYAAPALIAELEQAREDAARYRKRRDAEWLRLAQQLPAGHTTSKVNHAQSYDAYSDAIDAARKESA